MLLRRAYLETYIPEDIDPIHVESILDYHLEKEHSNNTLTDYEKAEYNALEYISFASNRKTKINNIHSDPEKIRAANYAYEYINRPSVMLTSFLGLPNRGLPKDDIGLNLIFNFMGGISGEKKGAKLIALAFFSLLWNILLTLSRFTNNLLKLVTEFLPKVLLHTIGYAYEKTTSKGGKYLYLRLPLIILALLAQAFAYFGRMLTSPALNIRLAYNFFKNDNEKISVKGLFVAGLTLFFTVMLYAIVFPLAGKVLLTKALPFLKEIIPHLPHAIQTIIHAVKPILEVVGKYFDAFLTNMHKSAIQPLAYTIEMGLGVLTGFAATTFGPVYSRMMRKFSDWCYEEVPQPGIASSYIAINKTLEAPTPAIPSAVASGAPPVVNDVVPPVVNDVVPPVVNDVVPPVVNDVAIQANLTVSLTDEQIMIIGEFFSQFGIFVQFQEDRSKEEKEARYIARNHLSIAAPAA